MSGASLQLSSTSAFGELLKNSDNNDFFFQGIPENITSFGRTEIQILDEQELSLGSSYDIIIPIAGHLLENLTLQLLAPADTTSTEYWPPYLAFSLINKIDLISDGAVKERLSGSYLSANYQLREPKNKKSGINTLVGKDRLEVAKDNIVAIDVPFSFFQGGIRQCLPIGLLTRDNLSIRVTLNQSNVLLKNNYLKKIKLALYGGYIQLEPSVFDTLRKKQSVNYLIKRVETTTTGCVLNQLTVDVPIRFGASDKGGDNAISTSLPFQNPVVDLIWCIPARELLSPATFATNPPPPEDFRGQVKYPGGDYSPIRSSQILFGEVPRTPLRNQSYYEIETPQKYASAVPDVVGLNYFSFSLEPDDSSIIIGYADMGSIENPRLVTYPEVGTGKLITPDGSTRIPATIEVYARVYDIVMVRGGRLEYYLNV